MPNLFWKKPGGKTLNLVPTKFRSEEEFEKFIFDTKEILEDVFLLKRQVRGGRKSGVPDLVGIDSDGKVCIVEMKNVAIDASIIPQVLAYAFWAKKNPDSIKNLWLEAPKQPEDLVVNWDNYEVRIIVIAPEIERSTLELVNTINYQVDLIEIKRWAVGSNQFLFVNKLEPEQPKKIKTVRGLGVYDREFYESNYNKNSVEYFYKYIKETERLVKFKGWPLEPKYTMYYCGFKYGTFNAFGIEWMGSKTFAFFFRLPQTVAEKAQPKGLKMDKYQWRKAFYKIDPSKTKVGSYLPLFKKAFESVTGKVEGSGSK